MIMLQINRSSQNVSLTREKIIQHLEFSNVLISFDDQLMDQEVQI